MVPVALISAMNPPDEYPPSSERLKSPLIYILLIGAAYETAQIVSELACKFSAPLQKLQRAPRLGSSPPLGEWMFWTEVS